MMAWLRGTRRRPCGWRTAAWSATSEGGNDPATTRRHRFPPPDYGSPPPACGNAAMLRRSLRPAGFDELGLRRALADRVLPFLVAAMALLAALALAGWVGAASLARHWQEGAGAALTVQVPQPGDPAAQGGGTRLDRVLALL